MLQEVLILRDAVLSSTRSRLLQQSRDTIINFIMLLAWQHKAGLIQVFYACVSYIRPDWGELIVEKVHYSQILMYIRIASKSDSHWKWFWFASKVLFSFDKLPPRTKQNKAWQSWGFFLCRRTLNWVYPLRLILFSNTYMCEWTNIDSDKVCHLMRRLLTQ